MIKTIVIKHSSIDDLAGYDGLEAGERPNGQKTENAIYFEGLDDLLKKYEQALDIKETMVLKIKELIENLNPPILSPEQINMFLPTTIKYESHPNYCKNTGQFITTLIQRSYDAGHNNFFIDVSCLKPLECIGHNLIGNEERRIVVSVRGNTSLYCGVRLSFGVLTIHGKTGVHIGLFAENSVFKTSNATTLVRMINDVQYQKANKIYFVYQDGSEELVWKR